MYYICLIISKVPIIVCKLFSSSLTGIKHHNFMLYAFIYGSQCKLFKCLTIIRRLLPHFFVRNVSLNVFVDEIKFLCDEKLSVVFAK